MGKNQQAKLMRRTIRRTTERYLKKEEADRPRQLTRVEHAQSPWDAALADDAAYRDQTDTNISFGSVRRGMERLAKERGEFAGIPMPLENQPITVEPSYPFAKAFDVLNQSKQDEPPKTARIRNMFWSASKRGRIIIGEEGGKVVWGLEPGIHHFGMDLQTLGCADAWALDTEHTALGSLRTLVGHRAFRQYLLTGSFLETSAKSRVTYVFRKLKPTVALSSRSGQMKILCALCLHPIAYYQGSWAGAMCPTDDVIAHLMLMRGDEPMFWKRANQHAAWTPEAGL